MSLAVLTWPQQPEPVYHTHTEFAEAADAGCCPNGNFLKGAKWSPDGACLLTASDDKWLRVYDLPQDALTRPSEAAAAEDAAAAAARDAERRAGGAAAGASGRGASAGGGDSLRSALRVHAGESVYDYAWFSAMSTADPASCCFASTTRGHPIHLWDACSGQLRCSYRAHDDADDPTAAFSVAFSPDGSKLLGGYAKCFRLFDVSRPGRDCRKVATQRRDKEGSMAGIVSCLAFNPPTADLLAAGTYSGAVGLFDGRAAEAQLMLLEGHKGGVTQARAPGVLFSRDGNYLYSGARRDGRVICWDVRAAAAPLYELPRDAAATNQRLGFSIDPSNRHLATGGCDGRVRVFDLRDGSEVGSFQAAADTVSGCDLHPVMGLPLLATASGHRRYPLAPGSDDEGEGGGGGGGAPLARDCNALRLWRLGFEWEAADGGAAGAAEAAAAAAGEGAAAAAAQGAGGGSGGGFGEGAYGGGLPYVTV
ncbi:MAG: WD40-repeat-containing domain protein [Monoraphidium minutum]|nr:MAG: WD40-repeat-containing domain protein [Monoraphidium minutum]